MKLFGIIFIAVIITLDVNVALKLCDSIFSDVIGKILSI